MNSTGRNSLSSREFRRKIAALAATAVALFLGGCGTAAVASRLDTGLTVSAAVVTVPAGTQIAAAEATAAAHPGDFVVQGAGTSMSPRYLPGTALVVHPTSFFMLRAGMPVVYVNGRGTQVAHVLVAETSRGWVAGGINNPAPDRDLVTPANLVGIIRVAFAAQPLEVAAQLLDRPGSHLALLH